MSLPFRTLGTLIFLGGVATLYAGPLATGFAFWASQTIARALPPTVTAMGMLLTPVIGLTASALFLGEAIGPLDLLGFAVTASAGRAELLPIAETVYRNLSGKG